ncbi:MAG TPA: endolytic transglycosylase MltG [bacterium]|nr:endolytic transglycosylase MltG [bacterium]HPP30015.1 endolytic transglycosylase MltG [bacterium]
MKSKLISVILSVLILGVIIIKLVTLPPEVKTAKLVEIPEGATAVDVAKLLEEKGVIKNDDWFLYLTRRYNVQEKLQAGIYEFSGRTPLKEVIRKIARGEVILVRVTVPEGSTIKDIADILERKELVPKEEFIKYALENKKLEGMLFPDTYLFPHKTSVEAIASTMYKRFKNVFEELYGEPITDANFKKVKEIVTVASIVEKEAMYDSERRIIAGIIYKRLKRNIPIQSCATVIYATGKSKSRLSTSDLKVKSPYNTYIHRGLPPGPICNPGFSSLKAALNPEKTDYLYFVSMGDGRNYFSKTYNEHLIAIKTFLSSNTTSETTSF